MEATSFKKIKNLRFKSSIDESKSKGEKKKRRKDISAAKKLYRMSYKQYMASQIFMNF